MSKILGPRSVLQIHRRIAFWTLAALGVPGAVFVSGCGDDAAVATGDSGLDASASDSTAESSTDSGADRTVTPDATNDQTAIDSGSDTAINAGTDAAAEAALDGGGDAGACTVFDASGLDEASVQAGMLAVWQVYRCQGCHQRRSQTVDDAGVGLVLSGNNDGLGDSGMVFPPNLTSDPATGLGCWTDGQIVNAILHGKHADGTTNLCPSMPKWGNALLIADGGPRAGTPMDAGTAQAIVDFLRSLPPVSNRVMTTMCPAAMADGGGDASDASDGGPAPDAADATADGSDTGTASDSGDGATE